LESTEPWRAEQRPATIRQITRFDHQPHLLLGKLADCTACHRLKKTDAGTAVAQATVSEPQRSVQSSDAVRLIAQADALPATTSHHPWVVSEFEPMKMADCLQCHRPGAAGDNCTQCHNYHVGKSGWAWDVKTKSKSQMSYTQITEAIQNIPTR
jgi:hypothetical protein